MKKSPEVCLIKKTENDNYNLPYVSYAGDFRRERYCIILNLKYTIEPLPAAGVFLYPEFISGSFEGKNNIIK